MIDIIFYGHPIGKGRPRFGRTGGGAPVTYTPKKTKDYERDLASLAQVAMKGQVPTEQPVKITIDVFFTHKTKTGWHTSRPDLDNIVKIVLDGLNGVVFKDDSCVVQIIASKKYDDKDEERVEIKVDNV